MRRALPMLTTAALLVGACSGGSDDTSDSTVASSETVATTTEASAPATEASTTLAETTTTSEAPTTTIDEAAVLAEAEAAYLQAFEVGIESIRNPDDPDTEPLLREHFTGPNLEEALENLARANEGGFIAREDPDNPSFALVVQPAEFVDGNSDEVLLGVCEFNSDPIFEVGTGPDGGDALRRDDPVSLLFAVRMEREDGQWKSSVGTLNQEIFDEAERCSSVS